VLLCPERKASDAQLEAMGRWTLTHFTGRCWIGVDLVRRLDDELWLHRMRALSALTAVPLVAVGDVHMHVRSRKPLQDVLTATRMGKPLTECGYALQRSAERHLRSRLRLAQTFPAELLAQTLAVVARCNFSLDELQYQYPDEVVPAGHTAASYLRQTYDGARRRWPAGIPESPAPDRARAGSDLRAEVRAVLPDRLRHRGLRRSAAFVPGPRLGCQQRGVTAWA
jgi:error-prone DNA polymerase